MIERLAGAAARAFLVALVIATPALILPHATADTSHVTIFIAAIAALFTFVEYSAASPSIVEFRDARPLNRLRYLALFGTVLCLSLIFKGQTQPTEMTRALTAIGTIIANSIDFAASPVRLVVRMLPEGATPDLIALVRTAAGIAYLASLTAMAAFLYLVRVKGWPSRGGAFNIWVNLPQFDPTAGGDVLYRLQRDAWVNIVLGFLLPFVIPVVVKATADLLNPIMFDSPQTLIWTMTAWAFLPASMIMRGIAMQRIAEMIRDQRKRAYARSGAALQVV